MFGETLKKLRKQKGLSQNELGIKMGVTQQTIAQYEKARKAPKMETLENLAKALDIKVEELLSNSIDFSKFNKLIDEEKMQREYNFFETLPKFLKSFGYTLESTYDEVYDYEILEDGSKCPIDFTFNFIFSKDGEDTILTDKEFKEFEAALENTIEFVLWKKRNSK